MIKVVGIDPGLRTTGVAVVQGRGLEVAGWAAGAIKTCSRLPEAARLSLVFDGVTRVLCRESPDLMVIEESFSLEAYPKSGLVLGKVTGVILLAGHRHGVGIKEVSVRKAKQVLTGNGNADKSQMERAVRTAVGTKQKITPDHASDALAMALIGLYRFSDGRFLLSAETKNP